MEFKEKLKFFRQEKGYTQKELADILNLSKNSVCEWEKGRCEPNIETLKALSKIFDTDLNDLIGNEENVSTVRDVSLLKNTSVHSKMNKLKLLRKERGLTLQEMADILNVSRGSYNYYELGKTEPSINILFQLSDFFGVSIDYLLGHSESSPTVRNVAPEPLAEEEKELLNLYKNASLTGKKIILGNARTVKKYDGTTIIIK